MPKAIRSRSVKGSGENLRMVSMLPSRATGGITALTREPSARRASTIGWPRRCAGRPGRRSCRSCGAGGPRRAKAAVDRGDPARRARRRSGRAVDHDLGDLRVAQQRLEGTVTEDLVRDLLGDAGAVGEGERGLLGFQHRLQGEPHLLLEVRVLQVRVVELADRAGPSGPGARSPSPWRTSWRAATGRRVSGRGRPPVSWLRRAWSRRSARLMPRSGGGSDEHRGRRRNGGWRVRRPARGRGRRRGRPAPSAHGHVPTP